MYSKQRRALAFVRWIDDRTHFSRLLNLLHEKTVPRHKYSFWYIFGGLALFFFMIQVLTGVLLLFYYSPTPTTAYESIQFIIAQVPFGWLIRSLHSWSSNLLIAIVFVHLFSVFFLRAYRKPREILWFTGVILLFLMLGFGFTGYLLPWDTTAYFATKIGTEIPRTIPVIGELVVRILRGGEYIAEECLKRLFALHVVVLPLITMTFTLVHLILNQVHGSSIPIGTVTRQPGIPFYPNYVYRDMMSWLAGLAILVALALILPVQLGPKADPYASAPLGIKPEWYFLILFETLRFVPAQVFGVSGELLVNLGVMAAGAAVFFVPLLDKQSAMQRPSPVFTVVGIAALAYMVLTILLAYWTT